MIFKYKAYLFNLLEKVRKNKENESKTVSFRFDHHQISVKNFFDKVMKQSVCEKNYKKVQCII